jgi:hypothetical protein
MAFSLQGFARVTTSSNSSAPTMWAYKSASDTLSTILASGYFNSIYDRLTVGDIIHVVASNDVQLIKVTAVSSTATTTAQFSEVVDDGSITTAKLAAGAVTLAKLDAGITPSHVVRFGGKANNGGGSATITISSLTGVTSAMLGFAQIQASTNAVSVQKVTPGTDQLVVLLSGDPGAGTVVTYQILSAAS